MSDQYASKLQFGDGITAADQGGGVVLLSAAGGGGGAISWQDVGNPVGPGGIVFDQPESGGWLYVTTNQQHSMPSTPTARSAGIMLDATGTSTTTGYLVLRSSYTPTTGPTREASITIEPTGIVVEADAGGEVDISGDAGVTIGVGSTAGANLVLSNTGAGSGSVVRVQLAAASRLQVWNSAGVAIFEVREGGSIHGRASVGAITWDL